MIFIPGMGADGRMFAAQRAHGFDFDVPPWLIPNKTDSLRDYAKRLRDVLKLSGPCIIMGVSFGGMVAGELGSLCDAKCVLLVASCRSRNSIPRYYWPVELVSRALPDWAIRRRVAVSSRLMAQLESLDEEQFALIRRMAMDISIPFLRRVGRMILNWSGAPPLPCPSFHIHGQIDRIIPQRMVRADQVVLGGGHLINMTFADQVNRFIETSLARVGLQAPRRSTEATPT